MKLLEGLGVAFLQPIPRDESLSLELPSLTDAFYFLHLCLHMFLTYVTSTET